MQNVRVPLAELALGVQLGIVSVGEPRNDGS